MPDIEVWLKAFSATDQQFLIAVAVLTFSLHRWRRCPEDVALLGPLLLGLAYGVWQALEQHYAFGSHVLFKGVFMAAGAILIARLVHKILPTLWGANDGGTENVET